MMKQEEEQENKNNEEGNEREKMNKKDEMKEREEIQKKEEMKEKETEGRGEMKEKADDEAAEKKGVHELFMSNELYEAEKEKKEIAEEREENETYEKSKVRKIGVKEEKNFFILISILVIIGIVLFGGIAYHMKKTPKTIDELHELNLMERLEPDKGYLYNGFSFVKFGNSWLTRFMKKDATQSYNVELRYGPKEVEDIAIDGDCLRVLEFNSTYITFDPTQENLSYTALAAADLSQSMVNILHVVPFAACTQNKTRVCNTRAIVEGCAGGMPVIYLKSAETPKITARGSCVTVEGDGFDLVRAADRLLLAWFGVMP